MSSVIGSGHILPQPGAPIDNNASERALKKAILHRKNSMFYKTRIGARLGDLFMSIFFNCARPRFPLLCFTRSC
ncbi:MAG: transposase [Verrucomicrobiota bacterium]|nr:transposase [Verrucomicrobiota bacterium]